jgi:hypothetical protein
VFEGGVGAGVTLRLPLNVDAEVADPARGELLDHVRADVEHARPPGAEHPLVPRRGHEVGAPLTHVDRVLAEGLDGVDEHLRARLVGHLDDVRDRDPRSVGPGQRATTDQPGVAVDSRREDVELEASVGGLHDALLDTDPVGEVLPGEDPGRVFEVRADDDVPRFPVERVGHDVHPLHRAVRQRDLTRIRPEVVGNRLPGGLPGRARHLVHAVLADRVGLVPPVDVGDRVEHALGRWPARTGIEVRTVRECRDVGTQRLGVHTPSSGPRRFNPPTDAGRWTILPVGHPRDIRVARSRPFRPGALPRARQSGSPSR